MARRLKRFANFAVLHEKNVSDKFKSDCAVTAPNIVAGVRYGVKKDVMIIKIMKIECSQSRRHDFAFSVAESRWQRTHCYRVLNEISRKTKRLFLRSSFLR